MFYRFGLALSSKEIRMYSGLSCKNAPWKPSPFVLFLGVQWNSSVSEVINKYGKPNSYNTDCVTYFPLQLHILEYQRNNSLIKFFFSSPEEKIHSISYSKVTL